MKGTQQLHTRLSNLLNGGFATPSRAASSLVAPRQALLAEARELSAGLSPAPGGAGVETITIRPYAGNCAAVQRLRSYLHEHVGDAIVGAYVHGSIGTYEEIAYSDIDALVIVRDEVMRDPSRLAGAAYHLNRARRFFLEFDPLQHHGWFALAEEQLAAYPEGFLPLAALREAKGIVPDGPQTLAVTPRWDANESRAQLRRVLASLAGRLRNRQYPGDMYTLKVVLSNVLLLPALYVQAVEGRGIFKRESFAAAAAHFTPTQWAVMDEVSQVRLRWEAPVSGIRRYALTRTSVLRRVGKWLAPPVPSALQARLTPGFYSALLEFVDTMSRSLDATVVAAR